MTAQTSLFDEPKKKSKIEDPLFDVTANRHGGNPESAEANKKIAARKDMTRQRVYEYALTRGHAGVTTDEVSEHFDVPANAVSGRLTELKALGKLVATPYRRKTRYGCMARVLIVPGGVYK